MRKIVTTVGIVLAIAGLTLTVPVPVSAADKPVSAFLGRYVGKTLMQSDKDVTIRDLDVKIEKAKDGGFTVEWSTVTYRTDKTQKKSTFKVTFQDTRREGVFGSAMRRNKFGRAIPLDPLKGEPYVWSRIEGDTLTVNMMLITAAGSYEIQTYDRTLTDDGLDLRFFRVRDGKILKEIRAKLKRVEG
ncbi:MAG: hypothetical protein O3A84_10085 [Proteobacteria bacterium]|nr:hypothetical protein [Pseudomonadota bacterium]